MATLARRVFKVALFIGLCYLSLLYVRPYHYEWTESESRAWFGASRWLGVRDPEDLYFVVWVTIELIVAVLAYVAIMKLWRWYRTK
ncbi:hypothetical protein HDG34_002144 [Paraburkholderia sp. HC6.4b]|uniref:hypothetical protein n=1 Tax=unclassified Paraburkholderia TaxID=2615204 RepID=UPI0016112EA3|nr:MULTISPECIES: hypothetical protein [unclassified Paraburkholderia]MBB5408212.1 hypothetical protein [Paraburkholderia sp. HC6.4b]MBB5453203.1 hypothetical protein [Paraburkholderia sp. Kb1A]